MHHSLQTRVLSDPWNPDTDYEMEMENSMVDVLENALFGEGDMVEAFVHGLQARASAASGSSDIPVPDD